MKSHCHVEQRLISKFTDFHISGFMEFLFMATCLNVFLIKVIMQLIKCRGDPILQTWKSSGKTAFVMFYYEWFIILEKLKISKFNDKTLMTTNDPLNSLRVLEIIAGNLSRPFYDRFSSISLTYTIILFRCVYCLFCYSYKQNRWIQFFTPVSITWTIIVLT